MNQERKVGGEAPRAVHRSRSQLDRFMTKGIEKAPASACLQVVLDRQGYGLKPANLSLHEAEEETEQKKKIK